MQESSQESKGFNIFNTYLMKNYVYYLLIFVLSVVALTILPMLGTSADAGWSFPTTKAGWIIWITIRTLVAIINVLIFHSFNMQGLLNVSKTERYLKAKEILDGIRNTKVIPRSPGQYNRTTYGRKMVSVFASSFAGAAVITNCLLSYDYIALISYAITVFFGLIFGFLQMKKSENYWGDEYYFYALYIRDQNKEEIEEC